MERSKIEWTDHTFNPWIGCTKVSEACRNCYAEDMMDRRYGKVEWGPTGTRVVTSDGNWKKPLKWDRDAAKEGVRRRVFCASLADVFEDWDGDILNHQGVRLWVDRSTGTDWQTELPHWSFAHHRPARMMDLRHSLFRLIDRTPHLDWLLLTKRPENVMRMWVPYGPNPADGEMDEYRHNVWIGTSVENQREADRRIPELLKCPAAVRFLSCEPLLEGTDFTPYIGGRTYRCRCGFHRTENELVFRGGDLYSCAECGEPCQILQPLNWVIVGGESGHGARPMHPDWVRSIRDQCQEAGVPFFFKQWGDWSPPPMEHPNLSPIQEGDIWMRPDGQHESVDHDPQTWEGELDPGWGGEFMRRVGKKAAGRTLDGREWNEFPEPAAVPI